jgi:hypothetical protein
MKFMEVLKIDFDLDGRPTVRRARGSPTFKEGEINRRGSLDNIAYEINETKASAICVKTVKKKKYFKWNITAG